MFPPPLLFSPSIPPQNSHVLLSQILQLPEHTVPYLLETVSRCISKTFFSCGINIFSCGGSRSTQLLSQPGGHVIL